MTSFASPEQGVVVAAAAPMAGLRSAPAIHLLAKSSCLRYRWPVPVPRYRRHPVERALATAAVTQKMGHGNLQTPRVTPSAKAHLQSLRRHAQARQGQKERRWRRRCVSPRVKVPPRPRAMAHASTVSGLCVRQRQCGEAVARQPEARLRQLVSRRPGDRWLWRLMGSA